MAQLAMAHLLPSAFCIVTLLSQRMCLGHIYLIANPAAMVSVHARRGVQVSPESLQHVTPAFGCRQLALIVQEARIEVLYSQLQQTTEQMTAKQVSANSANSAAAAARRTASSLALQLEAATAELDALRRAAAAAAAEAAGCSQWAQQQAHAAAAGSGCCAEAVAEAVKRRDEGLIRWFEGRIALLLQSASRGSSTAASDEAAEAPLMALTRQVTLSNCCCGRAHMAVFWWSQNCAAAAHSSMALCSLYCTTVGRAHIKFK